MSSMGLLACQEDKLTAADSFAVAGLLSPRVGSHWRAGNCSVTALDICRRWPTAQFLNHPHVHAAIQQMGRERVPQYMRRYLGQPGPAPLPLAERPRGPAG
jgi:hypothetical protein